MGMERATRAYLVQLRFIPGPEHGRGSRDAQSWGRQSDKARVGSTGAEALRGGGKRTTGHGSSGGQQQEKQLQQQ